LKSKFAFCKVTWLPKYRGELHTATAYGNIDNDEDSGTREGAEAYLFLPERGICYGYVHLGRTDPYDDETIRSINIQQLDPKSGGESVEGVQVIWLARSLDGVGICIVGEYRDATVYRSAQPRVGKRRWGWNIRAQQANVRMIPEKRRIALAGVPLRQGNLWYAKAPSDAAVRRLAEAHLSRLAVPLS
jgi:hypothetical protein